MSDLTGSHTPHVRERSQKTMEFVDEISRFYHDSDVHFVDRNIEKI